MASAVRRLAIGIVCAGRDVDYVTLRPAGDGTLDEDRLVRGVHPMVGRRLSMWRLRNFALSRLDAPSDVLLFHADNARAAYRQIGDVAYALVSESRRADDLAETARDLSRTLY